MNTQMKVRANKLLPAFAKKAVVKASKNSPTILFAAGIVGVVGGTVLACRATTKAGPAIDEYHNEVYDAKRDLEGTPGYQRDMAYIHIKNTVTIVKLYAPAVLISAAGIVCLTTSHTQLKRRNDALVAAYGALHAAYENYRERVRAEVGEEKELDLYHAAETVQVQLEDGKAVEVKAVDAGKYSPYARFFDEGSRHWQRDPELNRMWIEIQQHHLNQLLLVRGHVFLVEAYDALDIPRSSAAQAVGWILNGDGDNHIDFGIFEARNKNFVNGEEPNILLDFNVDGTIIDKI